jgi:hypothetical protein
VKGAPYSIVGGCEQPAPSECCPSAFPPPPPEGPLSRPPPAPEGHLLHAPSSRLAGGPPPLLPRPLPPPRDHLPHAASSSTEDAAPEEAAVLELVAGSNVGGGHGLDLGPPPPPRSWGSPAWSSGLLAAQSSAPPLPPGTPRAQPHGDEAGAVASELCSLLPHRFRLELTSPRPPPSVAGAWISLRRFSTSMTSADTSSGRSHRSMELKRGREMRRLQGIEEVRGRYGMEEII